MMDEQPVETEQALQEAWPRLQRFLQNALGGHVPPVYFSSDVRDAGYKTASVDINAFPAGFNNLCPHDRSAAATAFRAHMDDHYPEVRRVLLLPEDHTRNPYYLHNVYHLSKILDEAGIDHAIGSTDPEVVYAVQGTATPDGHVLHYDLVVCKDDRLVAGNKPVDLVVSNNDFTTGLSKPLQECGPTTVPSPSLGWATRSKAKHFALYNHLAQKAARTIGMEPWRLRVETEHYGPVDFKKREGLDGLAETADRMLHALRERNEEHQIPDEPRVFIKDDSGTYGMGIFVAGDADEVLKLNSRARQKMDKGKYGHKVRDVIVQEAVPTKQKVEGVSAETVVYQVGSHPVGAFMRVHEKRGESENLNQPGMRFLPVCMHKECDDPLQKERAGRPLSYRETLVSQLGGLALVHEATPENLKAPDVATVTLPPVD